MVEAAGIEPVSEYSSATNTSATEPPQIPAKSMQDNALLDLPAPALEQKPTLSAHSQDKSGHSKCVISVSQNPSKISDDLAQVVNAWDNLPDPVKASILALVDTAHKDS